MDKPNSLAEQRDRAREAVARMLEEHAHWSRTAAERHSAKMEMIEGNRMEQLAALQERLREHVSTLHLSSLHCKNARGTHKYYLEQKFVGKITIRFYIHQIIHKTSMRHM